MKVLLDTHCLLWLMQENPRLNRNARSQIAQASEVYVSSASIWEIGIKWRLGKIEEDPQIVADQLDAAGLVELQVTNRHAIASKMCIRDRPGSGGKPDTASAWSAPPAIAWSWPCLLYTSPASRCPGCRTPLDLRRGRSRRVLSGLECRELNQKDWANYHFAQELVHHASGCQSGSETGWKPQDRIRSQRE